MSSPLRLLNGQPTTEATSVLGIYRTENKALKTGKRWLLDSLAEARENLPPGPLPIETGHHDPPPTRVWRRCPWVFEEGGSQVYTISDLETALSALVTEVEADEEGEEEEEEEEYISEQEQEQEGSGMGDMAQDGGEGSDGEEMHDDRDDDVVEQIVYVISSDEDDVGTD